MTWEDAEADALHRRLRVLAERSGLTPPAMDVVDDPRGRPVPARHGARRWGRRGPRRGLVVPAARRPGEQTWHLASALGHCASPVPRRRGREGRVVTGVLATLWIGYAILELDGAVDLPGAATVAVNAGGGLLASIAAATLARRSQAASDEAGREVLRRSGHDPAALTRQVFGDRPDPSWWTRVHAREPAPSRRVADAGGPGGPEVAPPLY